MKDAPRFARVPATDLGSGPHRPHYRDCFAVLHDCSAAESDNASVRANPQMSQFVPECPGFSTQN
jgi:hypothetical protein